MLKNGKGMLTLVLSAVLSLGLAAPAVRGQSDASAAQAARRSGGAYDQQIKQEVEKYLRDKDKLNKVTATVEDGIVDLQGQVSLLKHKNDAEEKIRHMDHVAGVRNKIEVAGTNVPDVKLRDKLADKLRYDRIDRGIMFNNLNIGVQNGIATVSGNVRDNADKSSALDILENTPGVKGVVEQIKVAPVSQYDDDLRVSIARRIYGRMPMYANDPQAPIRIVVEGGKVNLYGVVSSKVDRQIAEHEARSTPGVFDVKNHIVVSGQEEKTAAKE